MLSMNIGEIVASLVGIAIAISIHEFGHAYSAHLLGDDTAKAYGRMTLNPVRHVDPIGLLAMFILKIGWAKPVPVNPNNFKNYKIGNLIVSLAGVFCNVLTAILCVIINKYVHMYAINTIAEYVFLYSIGFAAFNLLPIPPLDGWGVISTFVPYKWNEYLYKFESMSYIILLIALFTGMYRIILTPIYAVLLKIVYLFV
ncbi:TPA: site-2 protease family protein [Clostridioides difficile]|uniref:Zn-dependent proteases n=1 Tax=Clostridioides difficile TaxID=1496 RepID=A0A9X8RFT8_CLODI|nr:site-2 protease family protein [Clostridioides difficile]AMM56641.1 peptidase [Clostridioides difficile]EGT4809211.1 site-2 protease family protein [Clostridioides difficile]EGT4930550.1 site-2 protease family protein [Clostridioides difficile]EKJ1365518.1 site-2 protease family protein [Clostridioides difficile]EQF16326.1 peptidase M50 family protein [Clostridioides difficile CD144]